MADRPPQPADDDNAKAQQRRRLVWKLAGGGVGLLVLGLLVVLLLACVLWIPRSLYPPLTDEDLRDVKTEKNEPDAAKVQELKDARLKLQNDARTTLLQGLGALLVLTGATGGVWATLRQVRASHGQLKLSEQGQVTDRYTRAVEQLGQEQAPVRLGALYSLEHLAQDNPQYRQTVVDVFCAYLRMPYVAPARNDLDAAHVEQAMTPTEDGIPAAYPFPAQNPAQGELQVRKTAQRLLADHLRCPPGTSGRDPQHLSPSPQQDFWPGISLDLTGATLVDLEFGWVSVVHGQFDGATFLGDAAFDEATFQDRAGFAGATFQGDALFGKTVFQGRAGFERAIFQGAAGFGAIFQDHVWFRKATFRGDAFLWNTTFRSVVGFDEVTFQGRAWFYETTFRDNAWFRKVTFRGPVWFEGATFQGRTDWSGATFTSEGENMGLTGARVLHMDDPSSTRTGCGRTGGLSARIRLAPPKARWSVWSRRRSLSRRSPQRTKLADSRLAGCPRVRRSPGAWWLLFLPVGHSTVLRACFRLSAGSATRLESRPRPPVPRHAAAG